MKTAIQAMKTSIVSIIMHAETVISFVINKPWKNISKNNPLDFIGTLARLWMWAVRFFIYLTPSGIFPATFYGNESRNGVVMACMLSSGGCRY